MKTYPFYSSFAELVIKPITSQEKDGLLAIASLAEVGKFIPNIDTSVNKDLLPVAFNACVVNRVNKNTDVIDTPTAIAMYKAFAHKPINVEHNRQKVIGMILTTGFSEFGTDKPLTEQEASKLTIPFNITLGGVIWRIVAPELADLIEESGDPTSSNHLSVSASWELGFSGYRIALLEGGKKNLSDASEIISDPEKVKEAQDKLVALGGDGKFNDLFAYRMPSYDVLPLGIGFTEKPAAEVKGVASKQEVEVGEPETPAFGNPPITEKIKPVQLVTPTPKEEVGQLEKPAFGLPAQDKGLASNDQQNENKISQSKETDVKIERNNMKINKIEDISEASVKDVTPTALASAVSDFIHSSLKVKSDEWAEEKKSLDKKVAEATNLFGDTKAQLEKVSKQVESLSNEKAEREKVEKFNTRMSEVSEAYEFDDEAREIVVEEIKSVASDEDFTKWKTKASKIYKGYAKKAAKKDKDADDGQNDDSQAKKVKKAQADDMDDDSDAASKKAKASATVDTALDNADQIKGGPPNGGAAATPSLKDLAKTAFAKEGFTITR